MNNSQPIITVVGSFAVGLTLRAPRFPVAGETLIGSDFYMGPGGKGSNQAVGTVRLGTKSYFIGAIGEDMFGDIAIELYKQEGVNDRFLRRTKKQNTGVGFITLNDKGDNHIVVDLGANLLLTEEDVRKAKEIISESSVVLSVLEISVDAANEALMLARKEGVLTVLNPAPARLLSDSLLTNVDVLTPNESELRILTGYNPDDPIDTQELALSLLERGVGNIVVTMGSQGALLIENDGSISQIPGFNITVVDTTGAGDAFNAALAVCLSEGGSLKQAVRFASAAGALACTKLGVIPALPYREDVENFLEKSTSL